MEHFSKHTQPEQHDNTAEWEPTPDATVFSEDGTAFHVEDAAASYGVTPEAYNTPPEGFTRDPSGYGYNTATSSETQQDKSALPFVGAVAAAGGLAYKLHEPTRELVNQAAEISLDAGQQAYEFAGDRPLLFAGVTALGIGAAMVKVYRDVRKAKKASTGQTTEATYGNSYQAPDGTWKTL